MHQSDRWTERLSEYVDGDLAPGETGSVERHLEGCQECRGVVEDLLRVRDAASRLVDTPPRRDLWPGIRAAMEGDPMPLSRPGPMRGGRPRPRGVFLSLPQLAAAATVLLLMGSGATWAALGGGGAPASGAGPEPAVERAVRAAVPDGAEATDPAVAVVSEYATEARRLEELLASAGDRLEPRTVRVLERNLAAIDRAIEESLAALREDPGNEWVRDHLRRSLERKVTYLREATDLLEWSSTD